MSKTATVHAQQKWEYMELTRKTEGYLINEMNELGQHGWELVSVLFHKDLKSSLGDATCWTAILKRPHCPGTAPVAAVQKAGVLGQPAGKSAEEIKSGDGSEKAGAEGQGAEIFDFKS